MVPTHPISAPQSLKEEDAGHCQPLKLDPGPQDVYSDLLHVPATLMGSASVRAVRWREESGLWLSAQPLDLLPGWRLLGAARLHRFLLPLVKAALAQTQSSCSSHCWPHWNLPSYILERILQPEEPFLPQAPTLLQSQQSSWPLTLVLYRSSFPGSWASLLLTSSLPPP